VQGSGIPSKTSIISGFGYLLNVRQELNLSETNLLDARESSKSVPLHRYTDECIADFMWEASPAVESIYTAVCRSLDLRLRLDTLNTKLDYAENVQKLVLDLADSKTSHRLEWIIIILIAIESVCHCGRFKAND
jgi:hypothetical protein